MKPLFVLAAVLIFGVLIAVHELGHFIAAKLCGVKVNEYSIGMGPLLWQKQGRETVYSLRAFPIGGYCAMEGEDEDTGSERALVRQSYWKQLLILAAGSGMNLLTGFLIVLLLYASPDITSFLRDEITGFAPEFQLAGEDGLMEGDIFYKIDGWRTYVRGDASLFLQYHQGDTIDLEVLRDGKKVVLNDFPMVRREYTSTDGETTYTGFGLIVGSAREDATLTARLRASGTNVLHFVQLVRFSLVQLFSGGASVEDMSGPVGIVATITDVGEQSESLRDAMENILYFGAFLAVNLAVMNMLPLPALDGGRIFFLTIDAVAMLLFRKKVPEKYQAAVNAVGMAALLTLMVFVTAQDVWKLIR